MFASYRTRLQAAFVALALVAIAVTGYEASAGASAALEKATLDRLGQVAAATKRQVERYFHDVRNHVLALSSDESTLVAIAEFNEAWTAMGHTEAARTALLRRLFLENNPHAPSARDLLVEPAGGGRYGQVHARYHPTFHRYQNAFGFYDIFLIDTAGRVLYTVRKEADLGGRLEEAPLAGTGLSQVYQRALQLGSVEQAVMVDYEPYAISHGELAAFVAAPIWRAGAKLGVLAIQVSVDEVNRVLADDAAFEFIAGREGVPRAGSRAPGEGPLLRTAVPIDLPDVRWTLIAEEPASQAFAPVRDMQRRIAGWGILIAGVFFAAAWWLGRSVTQPVLELAAHARQLGAGDFSSHIPVRSADELGQLAGSFNRMADDLRTTTVSRDRLDEAHQKLRELTGRLIDSQEVERQRLARELHDDVTQRMASIAIEAGRLKLSPARDPAEWREGLERLQQEMARLSGDIHGLSRRLHPAVLDDLGLAAAIEGECRGFFERGGPPVDLAVDPGADSLPAETQLALYRVVQEALRNIARHAAAGEVSVTLRETAEGVALTVSDNGRGFDRTAPEWRAGLGFASMEERMRHLGGSLRVESAPGEGTRIVAELPA